MQSDDNKALKIPPHQTIKRDIVLMVLLVLISRILLMALGVLVLIVKPTTLI